ncbi:hypothetical protein LshimejAT787_0309830 [Lyophyllum shimeji]|uniref:Uncharacterized protein n=1 Tax=Lyophyllum shimeji TaxID=47721 RepID=A0A9P3PJ34_LYOSH|nr:hypothetical protein LshimejAT787_0309830 [Lyophyllum shimeji]
MMQNDSTPAAQEERPVNAANAANVNNKPATTTESSNASPAIQMSAHAVAPTQAVDFAAAKQPVIREALATAGYLGPYTLSSGFNLGMVQRHSSQLQEIHIDIDVRRPSAALRTAVARALFPAPGIVHVRGEREYALPIIPPRGSAMDEKEYWSLAIKEGIYKGDLGNNGRPAGAPPFQIGDIEEEEVKRGFWSSLKCW